MKVFDFSQLIEHLDWIIPTIVAIVGWLAWAKNKYLKPKIKFTISNGHYSNRKNPKTGHDFDWAILEVKNGSKTLISGCRGYITRIAKREDDGNLEKPGLLDSKLPLSWSNTDGLLASDILAKQSSMLDLFCFRGDGMEFARDADGRGTIVFFDKGKYEVNVECVANNAKTGMMKFLLNFEQNHHRPSLSMIK